ncbi:MAG: protein kinase [Planctomycetes bacterium]|nr:protein kinase [Planctomycetota bacterium]
MVVQAGIDLQFAALAVELGVLAPEAVEKFTRRSELGAGDSHNLDLAALLSGPEGDTAPSTGAQSGARTDLLLARLLVEQGLLEIDNALECLRSLAEARRRALPAPRLGTLLLQRGLLRITTGHPTERISTEPGLRCPNCGSEYTVVRGDVSSKYMCRKCGISLDFEEGSSTPGPRPSPSSVPPPKADAPSAPVRPTAELADPPDVQAAFADPQNRFGKYVLLRELGRGGMGRVYHAWDRDLRRSVALKMLMPSTNPDPRRQGAQTQRDIDRFKNEARTAAKLRHANVVPIYEVGVQDGRHYLAMEYVAGVSFRDYLEDGVRRGSTATSPLPNPAPADSSQLPAIPPAPPPPTPAPQPPVPAPAKVVQSLAFLRPISEALDYAHQQGIVHRDVKPENILLENLAIQPAQAGGPSPGATTPTTTQSPRVPSHVLPKIVPRITDFGLARDATVNQNITRPGQVFGTPAYMSPEQALGRSEELDGRADIFALGVVLYEAATGRQPFTGESVLNVLQAVVDQEPVRPTRVNPRLHVDVETIVMKALEKDPNQRYPTGRALADDLGRFLDGEPIEARPLSPGHRLLRKARKNLVFTVVLLGLGLPLLAWTGYAGWEYRRGEQEASYKSYRAEELAREQRYEEAARFYDEAFTLRRSDESLRTRANELAELARRKDEATIRAIVRAAQDEKLQKLRRSMPFLAAAAADREQAASLLGQGKAAEARPILESAVENCSRALAIDDEQDDAYLDRALANEALARPERALLDLEKALQLRDTSLPARRRRSALLLARGSLLNGLRLGADAAGLPRVEPPEPGAEPELARWLAAVRTDAGRLVREGTTESERFGRALEAFLDGRAREALTLAGQSLAIRETPEALAVRALAAQAAGEPAAALRDLERAAALDPLSTGFAPVRGVLLLLARDYPAAERVFARLLDLESPEPALLLYRAFVRHGLGRSSEAAADLAEFERRAPAHSLARCGRALRAAVDRALQR